MRLCLAIGLVLVAACDAAPAGDPAEAVVGFYAAVEAGDCAAARARLGGPVRARVDGKEGRAGMGCEEFLKHMREHPLERVISTQPDGRDPAARLVHIRLRGRSTEIVLRVAAEEGRWKIFTL